MYRDGFIDWFATLFDEPDPYSAPTLEAAFEAGVAHGISLSKPDNTPKEHIVDL